MRIGIDIDDTLFKTREKQLIFWKEYISDFPNENFTDELPSNINDFGDDYIQGFWDKYREHLSFESEPIDNVDVVTAKLKDKGYEILIITSRPNYKYSNLLEKISKQLDNSNISYDKIITDIRDKGLYCKENNIDVMIDDSLKHIISCNNNGVYSIKYGKDDSYDGVSANNWLEIYNLLKDGIK